HQPHAVAESHLRCAARDGAVEHLRIGAVRVLLEEVMLHGPERVEPGLLTRDRLLQRVLVRDVLAVGRPRTRDGDLVEEREFHDSDPSGQRARRSWRNGSSDRTDCTRTGSTSAAITVSPSAACATTSPNGSTIIESPL